MSSKPNTSKWETFASNTTLHGLRNVADKSHSILRRAVWLTFLGTTTTVYVYLVSISLSKFFSRPIKTVISQETPTGGLKFPAVTICNLNKFVRSKINIADEDENFVKMGLNISGCSETRNVRGNLTCGQALLCAYSPYGTALVKGCNATMQQNIINVLNSSSHRLFNKEEFLTKYGHDIASMTSSFTFCMFKKTARCSEGDFVPKLTPDGICFTFNSGKNGGVPRRSIYEGPEFGLSIFLDVQTNESTLSEFSSGLKVIVHDQNTFVNRYNGFSIVPGTHASVGVKLRKHTRLPAPFKTNCRQDTLPRIGSYTKDGCIYQCIANMILNECGCRDIAWPGPEGAHVCSMQDYECVLNSRSQVNLTECSCSNACSELEYESRVSYSKFPDNSVIDILHHLLMKQDSADYMRQNYVFLQVGFQHLAYEKREDVPSYGLERLFEPKLKPVCSIQDIECVENSRREVSIPECPCSNACSELEYGAAVSYSKFPDNSIVQILHKLYRKAESSNYMKENYVFLQVGFQHLAYELREDVPSYGMESLFGELGGNMGLFLGCSLLTLCEFIQFLVDTVISRMRKSDTNVNPELNNP